MNKRRVFLFALLSVLVMGCGDTYSAAGDMNMNTNTNNNAQVGQTAVQVDPPISVSVENEDNMAETKTNDLEDNETISNLLKRVDDLELQYAEIIKQNEEFSNQINELINELQSNSNGNESEIDVDTKVETEQEAGAVGKRTRLLDIPYITKANDFRDYTDDSLIDNQDNVYSFGIGIHYNGSIEYICDDYNSLSGKVVINGYSV